MKAAPRTRSAPRSLATNGALRSALGDATLEETAVRPIAPREAARVLPIERRSSGSPSEFSLGLTLNGARSHVPLVADSFERLRPLAEALELTDAFEGEVVRTARLEAHVALEVADARAARTKLEAQKAELIGRLLDALPRERRRFEPGLSLLVTSADAARLELALGFDVPGAEPADLLAELGARAAIDLGALAAGEASVSVREVPLERVRVACSVDPRRLADAVLRASEPRLAASVRRGLRYLELASSSPRSAAVHNQAVFCAISRVALAIGQDPRPLLSESYAHAARFGGCAPVVSFAQRGALLRGELELPLCHSLQGRQAPARDPSTPVGAIGADELRLLAGCLGLASQLPLLRAAVLQ